MDPIPEQYTAALRELDRLFETRELTREAFARQAEIAFAAIEGHPNADELAEGISLLDPNPGDDDSDLVPLGGAESK